MKKGLLVAIISLIGLSALAELTGAGYYRIQNFKTGRYIYVTDNRGSINWQTTDADVSALKLFKGFEKASSNPETIIYIDNTSGVLTLEAQGTRLSALLDDTQIKLYQNSDGTYYAYASKSGVTKYLSDGAQGSGEEGRMATNGNGDYRKWLIIPVNEGNYFGVLPTVEVDGEFYAPFYADFAFTLPEGMTAFFVSQVYGKNACMKEITGVVPAAIPVFIKCDGPSPADNIINLVLQNGSFPSDNILRGVYFDNTGYNHFNATSYDPATMRVLGVTSEGKLGFVTASELTYLPANQSYLTVSADDPAEITLLSEEEFIAGITDLDAEVFEGPVDVYNLNGILVRKNLTKNEINNLPKGIYIAGGKKIYVK